MKRKLQKVIRTRDPTYKIKRGQAKRENINDAKLSNLSAYLVEKSLQKDHGLYTK